MNYPNPFPQAKPINDPRLRQLFLWVRESPGWLERFPTGPVRWDFRCEQCGHTIVDVSTVGQGSFEGRSGPVVIAQRRSGKVLCNQCAER